MKNKPRIRQPAGGDTLRQRSLDRGKRGALSEASTTLYQQALRSEECQGKRKALVEALHYNENF